MRTNASFVVSAGNPKGGVGKSLLSILLIDWFLSQGRRVAAIDADPNRTVDTFLLGCERDGGHRPLADPEDDPPPWITIIDTVGVSGSLEAAINQSDLIVTPLGLSAADLATTLRWYCSLGEETRARVLFVPNRVRLPNLTRTQEGAFTQLRDFLSTDEGRGGQLLPGLADRPAAYQDLYLGAKDSFFRPTEDHSRKRAQAEAGRTCTRIQEILELMESSL